MEWQEEGILLAVRALGEGSAVVSLLTRGQGRHAGLVKGALSRSAGGRYQPGNRVQAIWRARLAEHLGHLTLELLDCPAARLLDDADRLAGLSAALAVTEAALPEREPHPTVFDGLAAFIVELESGGTGWTASYVRWELALLGDLGYGLDLAACAVTGVTEGLAFVSPKSGRAVAAEAAEPWRDRLLPLPGFLADPTRPPKEDELMQGLALTGYFLERHALVAVGGRGGLPPARERLVERLRRHAMRPAAP
ncbi:DNA repair protein RecO [Hypericibacter adhaerens]|jgi:DNA repair protein RecO (recombination protein O)|uniref:DNA repair protein RecO n=1 Tax=Hypericibacter adhaerens TaxID=2602016 RepID=A0A5J6N1D6_9PROT|nr:DNA repair protein RecO [Hypericibacter adhaerens]QEX22765.1 DNA repair protein RecO [Hypericibacter adhaerens]